MIISDSINIYLKTTETCNLNCDHCFTSGSKGRKIFFNPEKTFLFLDKLFSHQKYKHKKVILHGGEPMLAPASDIRKIHKLIKDKYPETEFSLQTNLVYKLNEERQSLIDDLFLEKGMGTSWDYKMRFASYQQQLQWEDNVRALLAKGHYLSVMVSLNKDLLDNFEPVDIIQYFIDLGIQHVLFERITSNGNALLNPNIQPQNKDLDAWLLKMYEQTIEYKLYDKIHNMFLDEIATTYVNRIHAGNRCRNCEQSLVTINADGSLSGCPNSAASEYWGNIEWSIQENLSSKKRLKTMACELKRNDNCLTCPVNSICNGDCHRLPWQGDICAAPKSLMKMMKEQNKIEDYRKLML
jgi:radical SAM protein with 4Fe4S-binding SPASM domain